MSNSDKAQQLNARAVEKLNKAMNTLNSVRYGGEPDLERIMVEVLKGESVASLRDGVSFGGIVGALIGGILRTFGLPIAAGVVALLLKVDYGVAVLIVVIAFVLVLVLPTVGSWLSSLSNPYASREKTPNCDVKGCGSSASYVLNPTGRLEVKLCSRHKSQVEARAQYGPLFKSDVAQSVVDAYQDLAKAAELDPASSTIKSNLAQARQLAAIVLGYNPS